MKRGRMIPCCGKQNHGESNDCIDQRPAQRHGCSSENRGAHNKYAAEGLVNPGNDLTTGKTKRTADEPCDIGDLTVTLPTMVVGGGKSLTKSTSGTASRSSTGSQTGANATQNHSVPHHHHDKLRINSEKAISKKDKARQKFTGSILKRTKVLILDRASHSSSPYKVNSSHNLSQDKFKVLKVKAAIDKKATSIDERSAAVLKYRTPHFRAVASVEVPCLTENQGVQIGWIQACTEMRFINSYGKYGVTSWEFPEIVSGKFTMIGDADGKQYPWYGSKLELQTINGPTHNPTVATIHMNDNFFPQVTWYIPHPEYDKTPRLTGIHRKQKFYTFLVAKDLQTQAYHVLKTIEWCMELNITVSPQQPLGRRATLCEPVEQQQPRLLDMNSVKLQAYALNPPNANNAQTLVWRPHSTGNGSDSIPRIIVAPVETTVDMERYIANTRCLQLMVPVPRLPPTANPEQLLGVNQMNVLGGTSRVEVVGCCPLGTQQQQQQQQQQPQQHGSSQHAHSQQSPAEGQGCLSNGGLSGGSPGGQNGRHGLGHHF